MRTSVAQLCALLLLGCEPGDRDEAWRSVRVEGPTLEQVEMIERAQKARDALFSRLSARLGSAMTSSGPAAAISVCAQEAPHFAAQVAKEHGLSIGRTSFRLRSPDNEPPSWAARLVEERVAEPAYLAGPNGELGALLPIRLTSFCVTCHGNEEEIPAAVRAALAEHYPDDRATGFAAGDLRGWFWVLVAPGP